MSPTATPSASLGAARLGTTGAASFWLLLGMATSVISLLAVMNSIGPLVIFGPWAIASFATAARLLIRPRDRRAVVASAVLAAVSLVLSVLGLVGSPSGYILWPIILAILSGAALIYSVLGLTARPGSDEGSPSSVGWVDVTIWAQHAALVVVVGGFATLVGSFATWGECTGIPCEGPGLQLFMMFERSGTGFGPGLVTAALGLLLVILGIDASRGRSHTIRPAATTIVAAATLATACAYVVRVHIVPLYLVYGPREGVILVVGGATAALLASLRLRGAPRSAIRRGADDPHRP